MPPLWAVLALGCLRIGSTVDLQPQLASIAFATNNPTLTTVALEKPLCMFDSTVPLMGSYKVLLYVMADLAGSRNTSIQDSNKTPLRATFQQTMGGRTGPYQAAAFDLTPCSDLPSLDAVGDVSQALAILDAYLIRVGDNRTCLWDPNFRGLCNPPLAAATAYSWDTQDAGSHPGSVSVQVQVCPGERVHRPGAGREPVVRPHPHQPAHPLRGHRHVARQAQRRHDRDHLHPGLPALLPARGLRRRHRPQFRGRGQLGWGDHNHT
ncbi:uroplakin-3a isoform X2 [Cavia porcellus]|uniref:uroplakin-3a isoform X2 n=1 Tax=Cavia porcellus TaxID=10141 RepID=UPI000661A2C5